MTRTPTYRHVAIAIVAAVMLPTASAFAQSAGDSPPEPPPKIPAPGEPRAQEKLPEAPPEQILKKAPPIEQKAQEPASPAAKPDDVPNTLPPAKEIEPKVPNT